MMLPIALTGERRTGRSGNMRTLGNGLVPMLTIIGISLGLASMRPSVLALIPRGTRVAPAEGVAVPSYQREPVCS
jgi:uncharacterized membrane protein YccF (DUF307 family)